MVSEDSHAGSASLWIAVSVAVTATVSYLATINHGTQVSSRPAVVAACIVCLAALPPLFAGRLLSRLRNGAANQLLIIAWRMGIMLPALAVASRYEAAERKYYLVTLLACYFVSLLLESWLLIRDVRRRQALESEA